MSPPDEFWIHFRGKKFDLNKINEGDNKGALDKDENLKILFNFFDSDDSGKLEEGEIVTLINKITQYQKMYGNASIFDAEDEEAFLYETREIEDKDGNKKTVSLKDLGINRHQLIKFIMPIIEQIGGQFNEIPHEELEAIDFLSAAATSGEQALESYKDTHGIMAETVNIWRTIFNESYTKSQTESNVANTQKHVELLTKAAINSEKDFKKTFEDLRSTENYKCTFNPQAIEDCKLKSQTYASAKTTHDMINHLENQIYMANGDKSSPVVLPQEAAASIIRALNMCGITDRNQIDILLYNISESQKNNPIFSKYGGKLRLEKNNNEQWVIYRDTPDGYPDTATPEQLNCVVREVVKMLEKQYALAFYIAPDSDNENTLTYKAKFLFNTDEIMDINKAYRKLSFISTQRGLTAEEFQLYTEIAKNRGMDGKSYSELVNELLDNMSSDEMNKLNTNITNYYKQEYETAFSTAYGGEDPEKTAQLYIEKEQQGVQYIQTGLNLASMALMVIPGGALASAPGWLVKSIQVAKTVTPLLLVTHPLDFLEKWTSNGISKEEFDEWFMSCAESALFTVTGMGVGKLAECFSSVYKAKALVTFLKGSGKSVDEITAIIKANPLKFPKEVVEGLKNINKVAERLKIGTEAAMDLSSTYALNKRIHGEGLTSFDWIQSVASAVAGSKLQKQFAPMSTEAKIDRLVNAFEDFNLSREDAARILTEMDKVSAGEYDTPKTKSKLGFGLGDKIPEGTMLGEITIKPDDGIKDVNQKRTAANTSKSSNLIDDVNRFIDGLDKNGNDYIPEFSESTSPLFKEYFDYMKAEDERLASSVVRGRKHTKRSILKGLEDFILTKSKFATREDYIKITDEIAKLMPDLIKEKYPNVRPEIAENADKIYRWKVAMAGQTQPAKPDAKGNYPITNDKFFDADARDKAVKEFTEFLEEMTGKKVLVGCSVRFDEFIDMMGCFNNPDFYKDTDYIVLGHGTGSSLVTDASDPNAWIFKGNGEPVWQYIEDNVPKGKKALLLVCEHDGLTNADRIKMPEMYDDNGVFMDAVGTPASGLVNYINGQPIRSEEVQPAKIVVSGNRHIAGAVTGVKRKGPQELLGRGGICGDVTVTAYSVNKYNTSQKSEVKLDTADRKKVLQDRNIPSFIESDLKLMDIDADKFNSIIQRLDVISAKYPNGEELGWGTIERMLQLDDMQFENISKRDLWTMTKDNRQQLLMTELAELSDTEYQHYKERGLDKLDISAEYCQKLAKLTDKEWQTFQERNLPTDVMNIGRSLQLVKLSEPDWKIVVKYNLDLYSSAFMSYDNIVHLLKLGEPSIKRLQERKLLGRPVADEKYFDMFAKMSDEDFKNVKDRNLTSAVPNQYYKNGSRVYLSLEEIEMLRTLDDNAFKKAQEALTTDRGEKNSLLSDDFVDEVYGPFTVKQAIELAQLSDAEYTLLKQTGALNVLSMQNIRAFIDFQKFLNIKDFNDLTSADKKRLASLLVKHNQALCSPELQNFINEKYGKTIIPKNQDEYCSLLRTVTRDSKMDVNPITKSQQTSFENTISDMSHPNSAFLKADLDADNFKLELKYPRDKFMKDVMSALNGLSLSEQQKIMNYYGFEVYTKNGQLVISGYPQISKNMPELDSPQGKKVAALVQRFTTENKIMVKDNPVLSQMLNDIFDAFPELRGIIGKVQHGTHDYTVDVHTLKVLQGVMSDPAFQGLSASDKKIITMATLMHDISKKEMELDKQHPQNSATEASQLLQKFDLSESERESIYEIIKYHDWLEKYNANNLTPEERTAIAQHIAYRLKDGNNFMLAAMLTKADLKGIKKNNAFWNLYKDAFNNGVEEISAIVKDIKKSQIYIPQTRIPKASQLKVDGDIVTEEVLHGYKVKVLHLKKGQDLSKVGFPKGTTSDDVILLYHGIISGDAKDLELASMCTEMDYDGVLSHSIVSVDGQEVYYPVGIFSYASNSHLIAGSYQNIGSGYQSEKTIDNMIDRYIFDDEKSLYGARTYFSDKTKEKLNIGDDEYIELFDRSAGMSLTELKQYNPEVGKAIEEVLDETDKLRQNTTGIVARGSSQHITEVLVHNIEEINPGCPYGSQHLNEMPEHFIKYAKQNDRVIIVIE